MYLYAIIDRPEAPLPDEPGLEGAPLFSVSHRDIVAVASPLTADQVSVTEANLWQHEEIVEALMVDRAVLPVRFGTVLADESALQDVMVAHYADFVADLDRVRGRVELGLRVLWDSDEQGSRGARATPVAFRLQEQGSRGDGRAYMMARLEEERQRRAWRERAETLATKLHTPLAERAVDSTHEVLVTTRFLLKAAYLVERGEVTAFQREVKALNAAYPELRFLCTGPWPAYNFVNVKLL